MHYLIEDPTYPLITLGLVALLLLVALQVTQQGKFLIWAGTLIGVALVLFVVERLVVTDSERIEAVVYELADAVSRSDVEAVESHLAPEVNVTLGSLTIAKGLAQVGQSIGKLKWVQFDLVKVRQLASQAGSQTQRGSAEFKILASGVAGTGGSFGGSQPFPATSTEWSLGFREVAPQVWKVTRITAIRFPGYLNPFLRSPH